MKKWLLISTTLCLLASTAKAAEEVAQAPRSRIMIMLESKFVAGRKLKGPAEEYVPDKNRNTIELVALPKGDQSPSSVSADGQVIFLNEKDLRGGGVRNDLMEQAYDIIEKKEQESVSK